MHVTNWKKPIKKFMYYMIPTIWHPEKGKPIEMVKRSVVARG